MLTLVGLLTVLSLGSWRTGTPQSVNPLDKVIEAGGTTVVNLPMDRVRWRAVAADLSRASGVPFGLEFFSEAALNPGIVRVPTFADRVDLKGMTVRGALELLAHRDLDFEVLIHTQVFNVRSALRPRPHTFLDRAVPGFEVTNASAGDVLTSIRRLFEPDFTPGPILTSVASSNSNAELRPRSVRLNVHMGARASLRALLNELAERHGVSWVVEYGNSGGGYQGSRITLIDSSGTAFTDFIPEEGR